MLSETTYKDLRAKYNAYMGKAKEYIKANNTNAVPNDMIKQWESEGIYHLSHKEISAIEYYEWINEKPQTYFGYINEVAKTLTTFIGEQLGMVAGLSDKGYKSNFGDIRIPIRVFGDNGVVYHGVYYKSAGVYARIKAYKNGTCQVRIH